MSVQSPIYLLDTLRKLESTPGLSTGHSFVTFVSTWTQSTAEPEPEKRNLLTLLFMNEVQQNIINARRFFSNLSLLPDARDGLENLPTQMSSGFSAELCNTPVSSYFSTLDQSVLMMSMFASMNSDQNLIEFRKSDFFALTSELRELIEDFGELDFDEELKNLILSQLFTVLIVCENFNILSLDAALNAYASAALKISRTVHEGSMLPQKTWWDRFTGWGKAVNSLGDAMEGGGKLIEGVQKATQLLQ